MKKILLNGLHYEKNGAGISKYTQMLIKYFIAGNYEVDILLRKDLLKQFESERLICAKNDIHGSKDRIIYEQINANKLYKEYDLIHFPDYATPCFYNGAKVATIHDMAMHTMRDKYTFMQNITKNTLLKNTIKKADYLICDSYFSQKELLKYYPEVEKKSKVIWIGIEEPKIKVDCELEKNILEKFKIDSQKYFLYVGTIAPHKNILNLIRAFGRINDEFNEYKLVIAGKKGWMYKEIFLEVEKLKLEDRVVFTDFVDDYTLEVLYKNTALFVSTSVYEGFGFPPLEAMIREIPVLVSDIDIFRETCEDNAIYCNPIQIEDIACKIRWMLENEEIRCKLAKKGLERAKTFNWEKTAKETFEIYESLI
ncbi:MAG: glycosyltransferase family 4 protein [Proteocatella sp.]